MREREAMTEKAADKENALQNHSFIAATFTYRRYCTHLMLVIAKYTISANWQYITSQFMTAKVKTAIVICGMRQKENEDLMRLDQPCFSTCRTCLTQSLMCQHFQIHVLVRIVTSTLQPSCCMLSRNFGISTVLI